MHTVHVITVLTTQRLVEHYRPHCITGRSPVVESVAVTVSGGGTTAEPGSSHRDSELIAPHSLSFSSPFQLCFLSLCMYITRITLCHVLFNPSSSSCSYSLLHPSSLGAPALTPSSEFGPPAPTPSLEPWLQCPSLSSPGSDCPKTHAPFPPSLHVLYSSANWIFITPIPFRYTTERYIMKRNNNLLTLLSMQPSGYVPRQTAVLQFIELF